MRPQACLRFLRAWQRALDLRPGYWLIRCVWNGTLWRNRTARVLVEDQADMPWRQALRWLHHEDVQGIEDAHSRAIKTGQPFRHRYRLRLEDRRFAVMESEGFPAFCPGCPRHCALIIAQVQMLSSPSDEPRTAAPQ